MIYSTQDITRNSPERFPRLSPEPSSNESPNGSSESSAEDAEPMPEPEPVPEPIPEPVPVQNIFAGRDAIEESLRQKITVDKFGGLAGHGVAPENSGPTHNSTFPAEEENPYAPFASELEWQLAKWAKLRGPSSSAFTELLQIPTLCDRLELSYKNTRELNNIIDHMPHTRPPFKRGEVTADGVAYDVFFRDVVGCVKALFGDPELAPILVFAPEKHWNHNRTEQLFHDMHTGKWWWAVQVSERRVLSSLQVIGRLTYAIVAG